MNCSIKNEIDRIMLYHFNGDRTLTDNWWDKPHLFFDKLNGYLTPSEVVSEGRGQEILDLIIKFKDIK